MSLGYRWSCWLDRIYKRWFESSLTKKRKRAREHREYCDRKMHVYGPPGRPDRPEN